MRKSRKVALIVVPVALIGFFVVRISSSNAPPFATSSSMAQAALIKPAFVEEIKDYRTWTRVNPHPVDMDAVVSALCAAPSGPQSVDKNPHLHKFITVYVNETGRRAMMEERVPNFPQGSVIVKEKLSAKDSAAPELLTVMIKRERGFNPQSGDWEYMVTNGDGTKVEARGRLSNCQACHVMNKETDFINRSYLPRDVLQALR